MRSCWRTTVRDPVRFVLDPLSSAVRDFSSPMGIWDQRYNTPMLLLPRGKKKKPSRVASGSLCHIPSRLRDNFIGFYTPTDSSANHTPCRNDLCPLLSTKIIIVASIRSAVKLRLATIIIFVCSSGHTSIALCPYGVLLIYRTFLATSTKVTWVSV